MTDYTGSCLCGTVTFDVKGHFDSFYLCHCTYCQKDTGSAHAANLFSQSARLTWRSGREAVTSFTMPATRHARSFCKVCGSAVPCNPEGDLLVVPAGCLDTPVEMLPTARIFLASRAPWDNEAYGVSQFDGLPDRV